MTFHCDAMPESGFGPIFLEVSGTYFPSKGWEDFGGLMQIEWLFGSLRWLKQGEEGACVFRFMDGPYEFHATRVGRNSLTLSFYERTAYSGIKAMKEIAPVEVPKHDFFQELLDISKVIRWEHDLLLVESMNEEIESLLQ